MRVIQLEASNYKRLRAICIRPDGNMQQITGRNAQGKSSVLDALFAALGGKAAIPERPIRDGESKAQVTVDLGDIIVTRKWSANDKSTLTIDSKDGMQTYKSPQAVLDKLTGDLSFDPLSFVRAKPAEQAATLRQLLGISTEGLDADRAGVFAKRTEETRRLKQLQAELAAREPVGDGPLEPVNPMEALHAHEAVLNQIAANEKERRQLAYLQEGIEAAAKRVQTAEHALAQARDILTNNLAAEAEQRAKVDALVDPDKEASSARIASVHEENQAVERRQATRDLEQRVAAQAQQCTKLTEEIEKIDTAKRELLKDTIYPVPGMGLDGNTVLFQGVPLSQASSAESIRVGLAVAAALNPKLRVCIVRDGSLLDSQTLDIVADWAKQADMQVLVERVSDGTGVGIVIEDGSVVES